MKDSMKTVPTMRDLLTIEEVMERLGISRTTVNLRIKEGRFHPVKREGRLYFTPQEVDAEADRRLASNKIIARPKTLIRPRVAAKQSASTAHDPGVPRHTAEDAAASVALFEQGKGVREAVSTLKISYEAAHYLWRQFVDSGPEILLNRKELEAIRESLGWRGGTSNGASLMDAIDRALDNAAASAQIFTPDDINEREDDARKEGFDAGFKAGQEARLASAAQAHIRERSQIQQPPSSGSAATPVPDPAVANSGTLQILQEFLAASRAKASADEHMMAELEKRKTGL
jgi:predicted DNA-binding transcriptional regulator AlpA